MFFLPPSFVFIHGRIICSQWKLTIESPSFTSQYYHSILTINSPTPLIGTSINYDNIEKLYERKQLLKVYEELGKCYEFSLVNEELECVDHFGVLRCIGMHRIKMKNDPLELVYNVLNERQIELVKRLLLKLRMTNWLKSCLVFELSHSLIEEMIMFRDDGIPIHFDGILFNFNTRIIWFMDISIKIEFGIQKKEFMKYMNDYLGYSIIMSDEEFDILEDFLILLHPRTRQKAAMKNIPKPSLRILNTSEEEAFQYYSNIDNYIPSIDW